MQGLDKFNRFLNRWPHPHKWFFERPHLTRRRFFSLAGAGVTGSYLLFHPERARSQVRITSQNVTTRNTAKNVIFILLTGAPSHIDTFDFKNVNGVTPTSFRPETKNGVLWPSGLLPKIGNQLGDIAIIRSVRSWALVHSLAQQWTQIGRNPVAGLGEITPNMGSIVALELDRQRTANQVFPAFVALNANTAAGGGYFSAQYAPFKVLPTANGLPNTTNAEGQQRADQMYSRLQVLDGPLRANSPLGKDVQDYDAFYQSARKMMYNPAVDTAFKFSGAESARYGNTSFGNACLVAKQILQANQGTRFVQINFGNWDMHNNIYDTADPRSMPIMGKQFDDGFSALIADLKSSGLLRDTLVVMAGEFGRTVGPLSSSAGRDHYLQQFAVFAGGGTKAGKIIGQTNPAGSDASEFGWSRNRYVHPEDIEATILSAVGINWTTVRYDDPFNRGFEYVAFSEQDLYGPVNELWT